MLDFRPRTPYQTPAHALELKKALDNPPRLSPVELFLCGVFAASAIWLAVDFLRGAR